MTLYVAVSQRKNLKNSIRPFFKQLKKRVDHFHFGPKNPEQDFFKKSASITLS